MRITELEEEVAAQHRELEEAQRLVGVHYAYFMFSETTCKSNLNVVGNTEYRIVGMVF